MMKVTTIVEVNNRTCVESVIIPEESRQGFRQAASEIACRLELSTYGPTGPVPEMTAEDRPIGFRQAPPGS